MKSKYWPADDTVPPSVAHANDRQAERFYPNTDGASPAGALVPWTAAKGPDLECGHSLYTTGRLRSCGYCGSMHPADLAAAIRAGAKAHFADMKYGWPHKAYVDGVPNPYAGQRCTTTSTGYGSKKGEKDARAKEYMERVGGEWLQLASATDLEEKKPEHVGHSWHMVEQERATTHGKFYTVHLKDASPEDRETIECHLGTMFEFLEPDGVRWKPWHPVSRP